MSLLSIFATAILPIVTIAAVGFLLGRTREVSADPLNTVTVYVLVPALIFHSLATTPLSSGTLLRLVGAIVVFHLLMIGVVHGLGRLLGETDPTLSALVLVASFPNSGNYGLPVSEFAFGATGRSTAVLYLTVQAVLMFTVGIYVASRSGGTRGVSGVGRVLKLPLVYAVVAALLLRWVGLVPPVDSTAMQTIELAGESSIPLMLLILGIQLSSTDYGAALERVGSVTVLRLIVGPLLAVGIALLVGFGDPDVGNVFVLESAMPAAVTPLILLMEFTDESRVDGLRPTEFVSTAVLVTTVVSVVTLTALIALMRAGVVL